MPTTQHEQWLRDTREFWDVASEQEARFGRVCSSPEIESTDDPGRLEAIWQRETAEGIGHILDGIPLRPDWTCVEIGCGVGRLLKALAPRVHLVIGVDLSVPMLDHARRYLRGVDNTRLILNDGRSLEAIEDGSVDFVFSHLAFQHITLYEVVQEYLSEIARVLKPGGYCRIQNWREGSIPAIERVKNMLRVLLGRDVVYSDRCWQWRAGRAVRFGGVTFHPRVWRRRLRGVGLVPIRTQLGVGHEYWMWTTSCRAGG